MHVDISQTHFRAGILRKKHAPQGLENRFVRTCSQKKHGHVASAVLHQNCWGKCRAPRANKIRDFVRTRVVESAHGYRTRAIQQEHVCVCV